MLVEQMPYSLHHTIFIAQGMAQKIILFRFMSFFKINGEKNLMVYITQTVKGEEAFVIDTLRVAIRDCYRYQLLIPVLKYQIHIIYFSLNNSDPCLNKCGRDFTVFWEKEVHEYSDHLRICKIDCF